MKFLKLNNESLYRPKKKKSKMLTVDEFIIKYNRTCY